ncbi:MAG: DUF7002 family protein [Vicinamibacterales bacterium]
MALDLEAFARTRCYAYHLTSSGNLRAILNGRRIDCAATLIVKGGRGELLRHRRSRHEVVHVGGSDIWLRDQAPLHQRNLVLSSGWEFADLVEVLNRHVFFWPGTESGPNDYGLRHFSRYALERPVLIRVRTSELLDANSESSVELCRYNSGSPRYSGGRASPRGPDTFVSAASFNGPPSKVVELVFRDSAMLPAALQVGTNPTGPWCTASDCRDVPSNTAMEPSAPAQSSVPRLIARRWADKGEPEGQ